MQVSSMASGPIQLSATMYPALCSFQRTEESQASPSAGEVEHLSQVKGKVPGSACH